MTRESLGRNTDRPDDLQDRRPRVRLPCCRRSGERSAAVVLVEAVWVLTSLYDLSKDKIVVAVEMLLNHAQLTIQDADIVEAALGPFRRCAAPDFSDCLVLETARKAGHLPPGTFDRALGAIDGAERL